MCITNIKFYADFELYGDGLSYQNKNDHNKFGQNWTNGPGGVWKSGFLSQTSK